MYVQTRNAFRNITSTSCFNLVKTNLKTKCLLPDFVHFLKFHIKYVKALHSLLLTVEFSGFLSFLLIFPVAYTHQSTSGMHLNLPPKVVCLIKLLDLSQIHFGGHFCDRRAIKTEKLNEMAKCK